MRALAILFLIITYIYTFFIFTMMIWFLSVRSSLFIFTVIYWRFVTLAESLIFFFVLLTGTAKIIKFPFSLLCNTFICFLFHFIVFFKKKKREKEMSGSICDSFDSAYRVHLNGWSLFNLYIPYISFYSRLIHFKILYLWCNHFCCSTFLLCII